MHHKYGIRQNVRVVCYRGVGGEISRGVYAQDHAPREARAMSKFSEFGKTVKP